jgi:hypothetical protein
MRLFVATAAPHRQKTDCAIVGLHEGGAGLTGAAAALDSALAGRLGRLIKRGDVHGSTARRCWPRSAQSPGRAPVTP